MRTKLPIHNLCAKLLIGTIAAVSQGLEPQRLRGETTETPQTMLESEPAGQVLVRRAEEVLGNHFSVSAHVTQSAHLFGQEVIGSGGYFEQRSNQGLQFRLEVSVQSRVDEQPSSLLQICDGRFLWHYRKLQGAESLSRIDLAYVQQRLEQTRPITQKEMLAAWPGLGGLPKLLQSFDRAFVFNPPESVQLQPQFSAWKVEGRWRPEVLAQAVPERREDVEQGRGVALSQLPEQLPNCVILFLGKDDLFPYSIVYYRLAGTTADVQARPTDRPMVRINFSKVRFDEPIHPAYFAYKPGDLEFTDQTDRLLERFSAR